MVDDVGPLSAEEAAQMRAEVDAYKVMHLSGEHVQMAYKSVARNIRS